MKYQTQSSTAHLSTEIATLCQPLELLGINALGYHKFCADGSEIMLSNDPAWSEHIYGNHLMASAYRNFIDKSNFEKMIWPEEMFTIIKAAKEVCNWHSGLSIKLSDNEYFGFSIAGKERSYVINTLLNNAELLEKFCVYFSEQVRSLVTDKNCSKMQPKSQINITETHETLNPLSPEVRQKFIKKIKINSIFLDADSHSNIKLTSRQIDIIQGLYQRLSAKEMAQQYGISHRTVEAHIHNLKFKLGCTNKLDLLRKFSQLKFEKYFDLSRIA